MESVQSRGHRTERSSRPRYVSMEAAYLHVRNLNEFLRREDKWQPRFERSPHGGVTPYLWTAHEVAIHAKLLHPDPDRPYEPAAKSGDNL